MQRLDRSHCGAVFYLILTACVRKLKEPALMFPQRGDAAVSDMLCCRVKMQF
jgi:hypothetical protein